MIQFNLLPDVKLEFVKAQRIKHAVISGAVIATGGAFLLFLLLFVAVHLVQQKVISSQTADIKKYSNELKATPDIDKILTIQNQLGSLTSLHAGKPKATRAFGLIQQVTPANVSLTDYTNDFTANTVSISGAAATFDLVNTMTDTLKYTTYKNSQVTGQKVFSNVVLSTYSRSPTSTTFTITASYDPVIYNNADDVAFVVPAGISTPSVVGQPTTLFNKPSNGSTN